MNPPPAAPFPFVMKFLLSFLLASTVVAFASAATEKPLRILTLHTVLTEVAREVGGERVRVTKKDLGVAGVQTWFVPTRATRIRANYQFTWENRRGGNRLDGPEYLANVAESLDTKYHRGGVAWEQTVSPDFDFHAGYSFAFIERDSFYGGLGDVVTDPRAPGYDAEQLDPTADGSAAATSFNQYGFTENPLHYFDTQFNWRRGAHALAFGVQHKRESVRDESCVSHARRCVE